MKRGKIVRKMIFLYLNIMEKAKDKTRENIKDFHLYVP